MKTVSNILLALLVIGLLFILVQDAVEMVQGIRQKVAENQTTPTESVPETVAATEETQPAFDAARSGFDIGTCRTLAENTAIVLLCADDDISSWDNESIAQVRTQTEAAAQFIREQAASYGFSLEVPVYVYATNEARQIRFDGTISTGGANCDALTSISQNWGFADKWAMHEALQEQLQAEQIAYVVAHNKDGYSFAQAEDHRNAGAYDWRIPEYVIIEYPEIADRAETILHEILHLFGAQDFYRKEFETDSGTIVYNETRALMAQDLYPYEIMLCTTGDISQVQLSEFTAYTVGWLDTLPEEYNCDAWWVGTQWEEVYSPEDAEV